MTATMPAEVEQAEREIEALTGRLRPHFRRGAAHRHAGEYVRGLLGPVERKNGWQLAEHVGHRHPRTIQRVLDRSAWDADAVRDDLLGQVIAELGDEEGVLVVDETGFLKKGAKSCGVARQYSGTAGRVENCQVGVFLGYASPKGRAGIDRALYLPREWADDAERRDQRCRDELFRDAKSFAQNHQRHPANPVEQPAVLRHGPVGPGFLAGRRLHRADGCRPRV